MAEDPSSVIAVIGIDIGKFPLQGLLASSANVTTGTVSAVAGIRDDVRHLQITVPIHSGNSGGPLFDMSGNIVGGVESVPPPMSPTSGVGFT